MIDGRLPNGFFPENTALANPNNSYIPDVKSAAFKNECTKSAIHGITQSGKTNALIFSSQEFFRSFYENRGLEVRILYVSNISSNQIRNQTKERFLPDSPDPNQPSLLDLDPNIYSRDFFENHIRFEHRSAFNQDLDRQRLLNWLMKGDVKIIFFDEGHIALNENGTLDKFFKENLDIDLTKNPSDWQYENLHLAWISATGYVQSKLKEKFNHYFVPAGEEHVCARNLYENENIRDITNADRESKGFLRNLFFEAQNKGNHILIRYIGDDEDCGSADWVKNNVFANENVIEFSSNDNANPIDDIDNRRYWGQRRKGSLVFLIRGGLRAGTTLHPGFKKRVEYAVDMNSGYDQTVAQSLPGRMTGYPPSEEDVSKYPILDNSDRKNWVDSLPIIYCNRDGLEGHLKYEKAVQEKRVLENPPSSSRVSRTVVENWQFDVVDNIQKTGKDGRSEFVSKNSGVDPVDITSCSTNSAEDVAKRILNQDKPKPQRRIGRSIGYIHLDGPNKNNKDSWTKLMKETEFKKGDIIQATNKVPEVESEYRENGVFEIQ